MANTETLPEPRRATEGSAGLDLCSTTRLVLTPQMGVQTIETDFNGPLKKDTVGLLFGRSSSALCGLVVHPGFIDPDYQGIVKVMVSSPRGIVSISPGDRVAQIVLLPSLHGCFPSAGKQRGRGGFVTSGVDLTCLSLPMDQRPVLELKGHFGTPGHRSRSQHYSTEGLAIRMTGTKFQSNTVGIGICKDPRHECMELKMERY